MKARRAMEGHPQARAPVKGKSKDKSCVGLILAGGRSQRFGTDKARHPIGKHTMIRHVYEALHTVVDPIIVSVAQMDVHYDLPVAHVADRYPGCGPLAGLHAGLAATDRAWVLVVACDLPDVTPDVLQTLLDRRSENTLAVVARTPEGRAQPLCACYARRTLPSIEAQLRTGHYAVKHLITRLKDVVYVPIPDTTLRNVNRPEDLNT